MAEQAPIRVQLSRRKGWRMPENTVKVDRSTKWGNPFVVGTHGTRQECVHKFIYLLHGQICVTSLEHMKVQEATVLRMLREMPELRGKHLACWCPATGPCHADALLALANGRNIDLTGVPKLESIG